MTTTKGKLMRSPVRSDPRHRGGGGGRKGNQDEQFKLHNGLAGLHCQTQNSATEQTRTIVQIAHVQLDLIPVDFSSIAAAMVVVAAVVALVVGGGTIFVVVPRAVGGTGARAGSIAVGHGGFQLRLIFLDGCPDTLLLLYFSFFC